jgi:hypothetical protein
VLVLLLASSVIPPASSGPDPEPPTWADKLEAWSTLGAAFVALAAAVATIWLLVHQIRETRRARIEAHRERIEATVDRDLARKDRELAAAERRDAERAQARTVVIGNVAFDVGRVNPGGIFLGKLSTTVTNYSGQPILAVQLLADSRGTFGEWPVELKRSPVLGPGETLTFDGWVDGGGGSILGETPEEAHANLAVAVTFIDAAGRRWRRTGGAQPELVTT